MFEGAIFLSCANSVARDDGGDEDTAEAMEGAMDPNLTGVFLVCGILRFVDVGKAQESLSGKPWAAEIHFPRPRNVLPSVDSEKPDMRSSC